MGMTPGMTPEYGLHFVQERRNPVLAASLAGDLYSARAGWGERLYFLD
jgi:hypothetical protein